MNKSISYFLILAFTLPLMGQEVEVKDETKQEVVVKQGCAYNTEGICISCQAPHLNKGKQCRIKKEIRIGRGGMAMDNRKDMAKKQKIRQAVRLVAVGSLAYYIGYHEGEKHFKPGGWMKRPGRGGK